MQDFRKLQVWGRSHDLTLKIYELIPILIDDFS